MATVAPDLLHPLHPLRRASLSFTPADLTPALWIDPSDAATVTISGSSGAYIGPNGLVCPGTTANQAQVTYHAGLALPNDIDCRAKVTATDWTPTDYQGIVCTRDPSAGVGGWAFMLNPAGTLNFTIDGIAAYDSTAGTGFTDGTTNWLRFTRNKTTGDVKFYTSSDGSSWTQLGSTVAGSTSAIAAYSGALRIGSLDYTGTIYPWVGTIHRALIYSDLTETTKVLDADFESATAYVSSFTESALGAPVYVVSSTATSSTASYGYVGPLGLLVSGTSGNFADTPSTATLQMSGATGIDLIAKIKLSQYSGTSAQQMLIAKGDSYSLRITSGGNLEMTLYTGAAYRSATSSVATGFAAGSTNWVRSTCDLSTGTFTYYTSSDGSSWTQLGSTFVVGAFSLGTDTTSLKVGCYASAVQLIRGGTVMRAIVKNGIDGTPVFDADFAAAADYCTSFTESSSNAATVTITATNTPANAAGACVSQINDKSGNSRHLTQGTLANMPKYWNGQNGCNCLVFDGTNDRLTAGDVLDVSSGNWTYGAVATAQATGFRTFWGKATGTTTGNLAFFVETGNAFLFFRNDGTGSLGYGSGRTIGTAAGKMSTFLARLNQSGLKKKVWVNGAGGTEDTISAVGTDLAQSLYVSYYEPIAGGPESGPGGEHIIFPSALADADITSMQTYWQSKWGTP